MNKETIAPLSSLHLDADEFRAALEYTQGVTGFQSTLIEKDYYCSLILYPMKQLIPWFLRAALV